MIVNLFCQNFIATKVLVILSKLFNKNCTDCTLFLFTLLFIHQPSMLLYSIDNIKV